MFSFFKKKKSKTSQNENEKISDKSLADVIAQLKKSSDFKQKSFTNKETNARFTIHFISTLIEDKIVQKDILPYLLNGKFSGLDSMKNTVPNVECTVTGNPETIAKKVLTGSVLVTMEGDDKKGVLFRAPVELGRQVAPPEVEYSVEGPKQAFVESLDQNINLIRAYLPKENFVCEELTIGNMTKTRVAILYIDGVTNEENIQTVRQRLKDIDFDLVLDSSIIEEIIADNTWSPFPELMDTERPVKVAAGLSEGKVGIAVDRSPFVLLGPSTLSSFFASLDDYYMNWYLGTFIRVVRIMGILFSMLATPLYVAVLTYHPEMIPKELMATLVSSRESVPFPPILEALFLEFTIDLLREAGARLPSKVGQTIGIVGGIVLGTASVEAGLTSNVLLILVSLSALAAFTTPNYKISNTVRLLRFPFLLFAQLWGMLGINICAWFILAHLLRMTSLGRPYLEPLYPLRISDMRDALVRLPLKNQNVRPGFLNSGKPVRFKDKKKKDIDE